MTTVIFSSKLFPAAAGKSNLVFRVAKTTGPTEKGNRPKTSPLRRKRLAGQSGK